jgi:hypothetical protein
MPDIEIYDQIELPYALVRPAMQQTLEAMAENRPPYEKLALTIDFTGLHVPATGSVSVRVHLDGNPTTGEPPSQFALSVEAESLGGLFPRFEGFVAPNPLGASCTELWLQGRYDPPLGPLGSAVDATVMHGVAKRSLEGFLHRLTADVTDSVKREQAKEARAHFFTR